MRHMTWAEVCVRRLARHSLVGPSPGLTAVVGDLCGVHAQVMSAAEVAIGLRVPGVTRTDVRSALWTHRTLVKTHGPRGTVHLLAAEDLATWCSALAAAPMQRGSPPPQLRMTDEQTDSVIAAISDALADAELTADELDAAVVSRAGAWAGEAVMPAFDGMWPRWRLVTHLAAYRGALCFGPHRGRKVTYTSPRRWIPGFEPVDARAALAEVTLRYLRTYGPATPEQFARWLGMAPRAATDLFESLGDRLCEVVVDGVLAWLPAGDEEPTAPSGVLRLLPYFDAYAVGCHPRELVFPGRAAERALAGGQAGNVPVMIVDGVVAGVWHQRRSGRRVEITVEPFGRLTARLRRELDGQVDRLGEVLEGKPSLTVGPVTAHSHL